MKKNINPIFILTLLFTMQPAQAGWFDFLFEDKKEEVKQKIEEVKTASETVKALSDGDITTGLKQALEKGVGYAVGNLGTADGFLKNQQVAIPMPDKLGKVEKMLRKVGKDKYADNFVVSMNRAAEAAVPLTLDILKTGITNMSFDDARSILDGPDDAATQYLQKTGSDQLQAKILPIVQRSTAEAGVTSTYKRMVGKLDFMGKYVDMNDYDIDTYVTGKTMDGLFTLIAEEEKKIRDDPAKRTSDILKQVFGSK
jgi:hypothetical protein